MTNTEILPLELKKLGLNEKEARVYLAALELGYTSIQKIAQEARISRPTTYQIVKSLKDKGLIAESKNKGKKYFTASSPDRLLGLLRREKSEIEEKEREFLRIIAALKTKYSLGDKREIKSYNDRKIILRDLLTTQGKKICVLANTESVWPEKERKASYQKIGKKIGRLQVRELAARGEQNNLPDYLTRKLIKQELFPETVIICDKVILLSKKSGIVIENKTVLNIAKSLFEYIWQTN